MIQWWWTALFYEYHCQCIQTGIWATSRSSYHSSMGSMNGLAPQTVILAHTTMSTCQISLFTKMTKWLGGEDLSGIRKEYLDVHLPLLGHPVLPYFIFLRILSFLFFSVSNRTHRYYQQFIINKKTGESNLTQLYTEVRAIVLIAMRWLIKIFFP